MTFRRISAALALALALPAGAQDSGFTLDLSAEPAAKPANKSAKKAGRAEKKEKGANKQSRKQATPKEEPRSVELDLTTPAPAASNPTKSEDKPAPVSVDLDLSTQPVPPKRVPPPPPGYDPSKLLPPPAAADSRKPPAAPPPAVEPKKVEPAPGGDLPLKLDVGPQVKADKLPKDLELDAPGFDDLDLQMLKDVSLCIFPFIKEDKQAEGTAGAGRSSAQNLESIQRIFHDVAKASPVLKDAIILGKDAPSCGIEDVACIAQLGGATGCAAVLAARSTREDNGFTLRARMIDTKKKKLIAKVNQVMATDSDAQVAAWAEGQACRALKVDCRTTLILDADRPDMKIFVDGRPLDRRPGASGKEALTLVPGVYKLRVSVGQRSSREELVVLRRGSNETFFARQTGDGALPVALASARLGPAPEPSVELAKATGGKWTGPVGFAIAGVGLLAAGAGGYELVHSKSLVSDANAGFDKNGGFYKSSEVDQINSAKSAKSVGNALAIAGAVLVVAGLSLALAF